MFWQKKMWLKIKDLVCYEDGTKVIAIARQWYNEREFYLVLECLTDESDITDKCYVIEGFKEQNESVRVEDLDLLMKLKSGFSKDLLWRNAIVKKYVKAYYDELERKRDIKRFFDEIEAEHGIENKVCDKLEEPRINEQSVVTGNQSSIRESGVYANYDDAKKREIEIDKFLSEFDVIDFTDIQKKIP